MLNFLKNSFRNFVAIYFWVLLVSCAIAGGKIGYGLGRYGDSAGYAFLGVLVGLFVGLGIGIIYGGFVATLIATEQNTAKTEANTAEVLEILKKNANAVNTVDSFDVGTTVAATPSKTTTNKGNDSDNRESKARRAYIDSRWDSL